jgi:transposase
MCEWAKRFLEQSHDVWVIGPQFVRAYVMSMKNDTRDAEAICEAVTRPSIHFVPIKRVEPRDFQDLHWVRELLIKARFASVHLNHQECPRAGIWV